MATQTALDLTPSFGGKSSFGGKRPAFHPCHNGSGDTNDCCAMMATLTALAGVVNTTELPIFCNLIFGI